jgi:hypothetical protein
MTTFYYEIKHANNVYGYVPGYYVRSPEKSVFGHNFRLMEMADRVWREDGDDVAYTKNCHNSASSTPVDIKEFVWVKLQARQID